MLRWPSISLDQQQSGENVLPSQHWRDPSHHHSSWDTDTHGRYADTMPNSRHFARPVGSESTGHPSCPHQDWHFQSIYQTPCKRAERTRLVYTAPAVRLEQGLVAVLVHNPLNLWILWLKWATVLCLPSVFYPFPFHRQKGWHIQLC